MLILNIPLAGKHTGLNPRDCGALIIINRVVAWPKTLTLLFSLAVVAMLPSTGMAQGTLVPGAPLCTANTGNNGGQQSSFDPEINQARSRAEGGIAGTEHSSFAEVGLRFIPMMPMDTKLQMVGIWPRGRLEGFGNINEGSYKARVILRDVTADTQLADQTVLQDSEDGGVGSKTIKPINNPFNLGIATFDVDLKAGNEYAIMLRLETEADGLLGLSDFLSDDLQATFSCVTTEFVDSDGDGLSDQWEQSGIDANGDGNIDLNFQALGTDYSGTMMKADSNHKDIFVEIDYFDCTLAGGDCPAGDTHVHQPMAAALDLIRQSFANAPVTNPDGKSGINLWIQVDERLPHQANCDLDSNCFDPMKTANFGTSSERTNANTIAAKKLGFHYNLWVHDKSSGNTSSGESDGGCDGTATPKRGDDFIVSLGSWTSQVGTMQDQAGTFMHELGHNLGLCHGGDDDDNCKPNYLSVMSYTWQLTGLQPPGVFDYSRSALPTLKENSLNEMVGIQDGAFTTFYGPPDSSGNWNLGPGTGPIDWDIDGDSVDNPATPSDINNLGITNCQASPNDTLNGFDDWANIKFNFRDSEFFAEGVHAPGADKEVDYETAEVIKERVWRAQLKTMHEYTAKLVCGVQNDPEEMRLARGFYATMINIHNLNEQEVTFFKKLALTYPPEEQRPGMIIPIGLDLLKNDEALKVDCVDIEKNLFKGKFPTPYIEGYVVIQSPCSLDVTGVYSSAAVDEYGRATSHSSIDVEQINERVKGVEMPERCQPRPEGLPDLVPVAPFPPPPQNAPVTLPQNFCTQPESGAVSRAIRLIVRNQGSAPAGNSVTRVEFFKALGGGITATLTQATPPLGLGEETTLDFDIPQGCYAPEIECHFRITVDAMDDVAESNEANSSVESSCFNVAL